MSQELLYEVSIDGADRVTCESLNLAPGVLTERNGATSTLTLTQERAFDESLALQRQQNVRFFANDVCVFSGTVADPSHSHRAAGSTTTFKVENWWQLLERMPWTFNPYVYANIGDTFTTIEGDRIMGYADNPETLPPTITSAKVITAKSNLFPIAGAGEVSLPTTIKLQVERLFAYMTDRLPGVFVAPVLAFGSSSFPRPRLVEDINVAQALIQALALWPSASFFTDYTGTVPVIYCVDSLTETERTFPLGSPPLVDLDVTAMRDLIPAGVFIRMGQADFSPTFFAGFQELYSLGKFPGLIRQDELDVISLSLDFELDDLHEPAMASALYDQLAVLRGRGQAVFDDPALALGFRPGQRLVFPGDSAEHGALIVQEVSHSFTACQTVCTMGYPRSLSLAERKDRAGWAHRGYWGTIFKRRKSVAYGV